MDKHLVGYPYSGMLANQQLKKKHRTIETSNMNLSQHKIPLCQVKEARLVPLKKNTLDDLIHIKFQNMQIRVTESRLFTGTWEDR